MSGVANLPIAVFVAGTPAPQGSKKANAFRSQKPCMCKGRRPKCRSCLGTGRIVMCAMQEDNPRTKAWRELVAVAVAELAEQATKAPCRITLWFAFNRPASHRGARGLTKAGRAMPYPISRRIGDDDKLWRAVGDALTEQLYEDDAIVVDGDVRKRWTEGDAGVYIALTGTTDRLTDLELLEAFGMEDRNGTLVRAPGASAHGSAPISPLRPEHVAGAGQQTLEV